jgi:hypothetical protein
MVLPMSNDVRGDAPAGPAVHYAWHVEHRWHSITARADGVGARPEPRTHEEFIAIRLWGYNGSPGTDTLEYRVEHPRWTVWQGADVQVDADLSRLCGLELARHLTMPASTLIADGSAVKVHWRTRVT